MPPQDSKTTEELLRTIPPAHQVLEMVRGADWAVGLPAVFLREAVRTALEGIRYEIQRGMRTEPPDREDVARRAQEAVRQVVPLMPRVINATGIIVHTGLGRSLLGQRAVDRLLSAARRPCALEIDETTGERSFRDLRIERLLTLVTGAEAASVVNNNAAAVLLILNTLAEGKEVIVSRGELVEIGGGFRIPEILRKSGALLVEVGTTNKTRLTDYQSAITDRTALILKVHKSNFRIVGFSEEVSLSDLVALGRRYRIPVVEDLGSGALVDVSRGGVEKEPLVQESVREGADLISFSGDKLLGGPQAGIIVGRKDVIQKLRKNPLYRAFRVDKLTLAALEGTLFEYGDADTAWKSVPTLMMIGRDHKKIRRAAGQCLNGIVQSGVPRDRVSIISDFSQVGGGALPDQFLPTWCVKVAPPDGASADMLAKVLRTGEPSVFSRVQDDAVLLDMRTVATDEVRDLVRAVARSWKALDSQPVRP